MALETYRTTWPIVDDEVPLSVMRAEATCQFLAMAKDQDIQIRGDIAFAVDDCTLVAVASGIPPARKERVRLRAKPGSVKQREAEVIELHGKGYSYAQIGEALGCTKSAAAKVAQRARAA